MANFWGNNYGSPAAGGDVETAGGLEPKRAFRFILRLGDAMETWIVKSVKRPEFQVTETKHSYLNHTFYYPARVEWQTIDFTVVDPVNPDTTAALMGYLHLAGYLYPDSTSKISTLSKANAVQNIGGIVMIDVIDAGDPATGEAKTLETWNLYNPWVQKVVFSEMAYEKDDITDATVTLRFDWATVDIDPNRIPKAYANKVTANKLSGKG